MVRRAGFAIRGPHVAGLLLLLAVAAVAVFLLRGQDPAWPVDGEPATEAQAEDVAATGLEAGRRPASATARPVETVRQGTLRGRVLSKDGQPVAGVPIHVVATWSGRRKGLVEAADRGKAETKRVADLLAAIDGDRVEGDGEVRATSDAEGRFAFDVESETSYRLIARASPPLASATVQAHVGAPQHEANVTLMLLEGVALKGRVLDGADQPVAATLSGIWSTPGGGMGNLPPVVTDPATGGFAWAVVPAGSAVLTVRLTGRMDLSVRTPVPAEEPFVVRVPGGGVVEGRVTDPSGAALRGVDLLVSTSPRSPPAVGVLSAQARAKTGDDGSYRIDGVPAGRVNWVSMLAPGRSVRTEHAGAARWTGANVVEGATLRLDLVLGRGGHVKGRVLDAKSGAPVADAEVHLLPAHGAGGGANEALRTAVDERGAFRFEDVPLGRYALLPASPRHYFEPASGLDLGMDHRFVAASAPFVIVSVEGEEVERDLELTPGLALRGIVVDPEGTPVAGAEVRATNGGTLFQGAYNWGVQVPHVQQGLATSGPDGRFVVENVPPLPMLSLYASKPPLLGKAGDPVRLDGGAPPPEVRLVVERGATVVGRVLDESGRGVRGVQVQWHSQSSQAPGWGTGQADDEGNFRLEGVAAASVQIHAWTQLGGGYQTMNTVVSPPLKAGEVREGVELKATGGAASIRGTAVDSAGRPAGGVQLRIEGVGGGVGTMMIQTQPDGGFAATVAPGEYTVRQQLQPSPDGTTVAAPPPISVRAPADGVRVVVTVVERPLTLIGGRVVTKDGRPVALCTVRVETARGQTSWSQEVVGGEFRAEVEVRPPFTLVASAPRGPRSQPLNYKPTRLQVTEATTDLVITLEGGLEVRGRVLDPRGEPVAGIALMGGETSAMSDATGAFAIGGFEKADAVPLMIQSSRRFVAPQGVTAVPGGDPVVVRLLPAGFVAGRVEGLSTADGLQAWVYVTSGQGQGGMVGPDGTFRLEGLPAEGAVDVALNVWDPSGKPSPYISPGAKKVPIGTDDLVLVVTTGAQVRGVVVTADGTPQPHVQIIAQVEGGASAWAQSGADGAFTAGPLPAGRWTLRVQGRQGGERGAPMTVDAPADGVRLVVPTLRRITVRLDGAAGAATVVTVWTQPAEGAPTQLATGRPDASGVAALDVGGDGPFQVRAVAGELWARANGVLPGTEVTLTMQQGYEIEGVVERDGQAGGRIWVAANGEQWSAFAQVNPDNTFTFRGLPPGRFTLRVQGSRGAIPAGEDVVVDTGARGVRLR